MQISAQQLAELLAGIARAQAAIVNGLENELAGVRSGRIIPALQNVAHMGARKGRAANEKRTAQRKQNTTLPLTLP